MDTTTRSELTALAREAHALQAAAGKLAERLDRAIQAAGAAAADKTPYKRDDGRLTDAGIAAVNAAFDAGATVTEVAKQFDIHVSGASNRKKIWQAMASTAR
jgi:hypothetical protein